MVRDNQELSRFEMDLEGGRLAVLDYQIRRDVLILTHTEVPEELRGRGYASELVRAVLAIAADRGLSVYPTCWFVHDFIRAHPEYLDMVSGRYPRRGDLAVVLIALAAAAASCAPPAREPAADLLIAGGTVLTMAGPNVVNGAVAVLDGAIVAVGPADSVAATWPARETIDATGSAILPGFVNAHTHAPMTLLRGIADDRALMEWLEGYIFPAEAQFVDTTFVQWGTRLAAAEMIRSGTTTFADMYYFEAEIARATRAAGMRAVLGQTLIDFPVPDAATWGDAVARTRAFIEAWRGDALVTPALAPHAPYTVSAEHLREVRRLADELGAPILIHVSETEEELRRVSERSGGLTPGAYLASIGFLGPDVTAAHGVWLTAEEARLFASEDVGVVHNPESNMMLASGVAPVPMLLEAGVDVGLGTDGPAGSNNNLDMIGEMASAARLQKVSRMDPEALGARAVLEMATLGGARALDLDDRIGTLEVGKRADVIVVDLSAPHLQPVYSVESAIVYAASGADVLTTVVDGRVLMLDRTLLTLDERGVLRRAEEYRERIAAALGGSRR